MFSLSLNIPFADPATPSELQFALAQLMELFENQGSRPEVLSEIFWASLHGLAQLTRTGRTPRSRQKERLKALSTSLHIPTDAQYAHLEEQTAMRQHAVALAVVRESHHVEPFVPSMLRNTALTRLAKAAREDVFALAKIAGYSTIPIPQKYVHPEMETLGRSVPTAGGWEKGEGRDRQEFYSPHKIPTVIEKTARVVAASMRNELIL